MGDKLRTQFLDNEDHINDGVFAFLVVLPRLGASKDDAEMAALANTFDAILSHQQTRHKKALATSSGILSLITILPGHSAWPEPPQAHDSATMSSKTLEQHFPQPSKRKTACPAGQFDRVKWSSDGVRAMRCNSEVVVLPGGSGDGGSSSSGEGGGNYSNDAQYVHWAAMRLSPYDQRTLAATQQEKVGGAKRKAAAEEEATVEEEATAVAAVVAAATAGSTSSSSSSQSKKPKTTRGEQSSSSLSSSSSDPMVGGASVGAIMQAI